MRVWPCHDGESAGEAGDVYVPFDEYKGYKTIGIWHGHPPQAAGDTGTSLSGRSNDNDLYHKAYPWLGGFSIFTSVNKQGWMQTYPRTATLPDFDGNLTLIWSN